MKGHFRDFQSGHYEKATESYAYFVPATVNVEWTWDAPAVHEALEAASHALGGLNACIALIPEVYAVLTMHITREAVDSSAIEGTRTEFTEALKAEERIEKYHKADWLEVRKYASTLKKAEGLLHQLPLSSRLIRELHGFLMHGESISTPGEFRRTQNWIGGNSPADAVFVPPARHLIGDLMGDLEKFIHNRDILVPHLIRAAMMHYQFETIHPFLDGNGRIGRMMIPLYLISCGLLSRPLLYLSRYFEQDRQRYYHCLNAVRQENAIEAWILYFLSGIRLIAQENSQSLLNFTAMKTGIEDRIRTQFGRKTNSALLLLRALLRKPVMEAADVIAATGLSKKAAYDLIEDFETAGILKEQTGQQRNRLYLFEEYVGLYK